MKVAGMGDILADNAPPPPARPFTPSPQQEAVFSFVENGRGSAHIEAVAGAGKTTTLLESVKRMRGHVDFAAFNKKIADEIKTKLGHARQRGELSCNAIAGTFHSFGFGAWRSAHDKVVINEREKRERMMVECAVPADLRKAIGRMVSLAKQGGYGSLWSAGDSYQWYTMIERHDILGYIESDIIPEAERSVCDQLIKLAARALDWSRDVGDKLVDFDDMIWLPVTTPGIRIWQCDWVLVDEDQDTNPARRLLARRMVKSSGRTLWVGDTHQAIYGFTGADADAVDIIKREFRCVTLPLTVTYRCPRAVVELARTWVSHIEAHPSAPEGIVRRVAADDFFKDEIPKLDPHDAILCRNTRPLIELAFALIKRGIGCHVEGREIGQGLAALAKKWKVTSAQALRRNLDGYLERESRRLAARASDGDASYQIEALTDKVQALFAIMEGCATVAEVLDKIERMFRDTTNGGDGTITLSTVHKAKGREWNRVYILGMERYMPSRFARQPWQMEQEKNLMYVAATRAKHELVLTAALEA